MAGKKFFSTGLLVISITVFSLAFLGSSSILFADQPLKLSIPVTETPRNYMAENAGDYVKNRVVVKFTPQAEADFIGNDISLSNLKSAKRSEMTQVERTLVRKYGANLKNIRFHKYTGFYIFDTTDNSDIEELCAKLRKENFIVDASPDYYAYIQDTRNEEIANIPNDTYFEYQYALNNTGQVYLPDYGYTGTAGADIKSLYGWYWTTGNSHLVVAVIDTGVAYDHEDLQGKIVPGYNFIADNANAYDDHGHGTFVASLISANTNNNIGIAGVCPLASIMPIKVADRAGNVTYTNLAAGIMYAADHGAKVINVSIGGRNPSTILENSVQYAYNKGCVIVCAAGNYGAWVYYPAAYDNYCIAVAASNSSDEWATFSNTGSQVDVTAPGVDVLGANFNPASPTVLNSYRFDSGTSFSSPIVAGAAALLLSYKPHLTNQIVMDLIKYTADDINSATYPGTDIFFGYGRLNLKTLLGPYEIR